MRKKELVFHVLNVKKKYSDVTNANSFLWTTNVNVITSDLKMGMALIKLKIMPDSPDADLEVLKNKATEKIKSIEGQITHFEEQPIAFGLVALIAFIRIDEHKDTSLIENLLKDEEHISSTDIIDYRREL